MLKLIKRGGKLEGHEILQTQFGSCGTNVCFTCGESNQSSYDYDYGIWFWTGHTTKD